MACKMFLLRILHAANNSVRFIFQVLGVLKQICIYGH